MVCLVTWGQMPASSSVLASTSTCLQVTLSRAAHSGMKLVVLLHEEFTAGFLGCIRATVCSANSCIRTYLPCCTTTCSTTSHSNPTQVTTIVSILRCIDRAADVRALQCGRHCALLLHELKVRVSNTGELAGHVPAACYPELLFYKPLTCLQIASTTPQSHYATPSCGPVCPPKPQHAGGHLQRSWGYL